MGSVALPISGLATGLGTLTVNVYSPTALAASTTCTEAPAGSGQYPATVTNLAANTLYTYRVLTSGGADQGGGNFRTDGNGDDAQLSMQTTVAGIAATLAGYEPIDEGDLDSVEGIDDGDLANIEVVADATVTAINADATQQQMQAAAATAAENTDAIRTQTDKIGTDAGDSTRVIEAATDAGTAATNSMSAAASSAAVRDKLPEDGANIAGAGQAGSGGSRTVTIETKTVQ